MIIGSGLEHYRALHNEFVEICPAINQYVIELYARPRKFILETGPVLDRFIREQAVPGSPGAKLYSSKAMMEFTEMVDEFTIETIELFNEHRHHVDDCKTYMRKTASVPIEEDDKQTDYADLTLELIELHNGLSRLKDKADEMIHRLEGLENIWQHITLKPANN